MAESSREHESEHPEQDGDFESREIELALPDWLADEPGVEEVVPRIPTTEEAADDDSGSYPAVATAWIDPASTRILTERAALLALVASQTRGAGWGAEPPLLAPIQPPVTLDSLELDAAEDVDTSAGGLNHLVVYAGLVVVAILVISVGLIWYFELL